MSIDSSVSRSPEANANVVEIPPATVQQRIGAGVVDFVIGAIFIFALGKWCSTSKNAAETLVVPLAFWAFLYPLIGHAIYGQTVGKHFAKIFVVRLNGNAIGWTEAIRRSAVDGLFAIVWAIGLISAISHLPSDSFHGQGWGALYKLLQPQFPSFVQSISQASGIWGWSEIVTMLTNRRRRAIHDFIGSTVVTTRAPI